MTKHITGRAAMKLAAAALLAGAAVSGAAGAKPAGHGAMKPAAAIADSHRPEANRKMDEGRKPQAILAFSAFRPGDVVADWGAGGGYYSELIADVVGPKGLVYAINSPAFYKPEVWEPLLKAHPNVKPLLAPADAQQLAPNSVDAIFAHLEYHDLYFISEKFKHPKLNVPAVIANWFAAVKPGGQVIVVDHVALPGDPRENTNKYHRIDPDQVRHDMTAAGFVEAGESDVLRRSDDPHNVIVFDPSVRGKTDRFALKFRKPG
ncbi:methyltransferase [Novosphingobium sp. ZN18A2]|uniref:class I SAM-dependent methyltransferase n=1 Tax=Novosphingobium sp. ZN18A2 TaxID=3079861 RepID=UPI0030CD3741